MKVPHTPAVQTPFDSVENAQAYIQLLIETLVEAKKEVADDADAAARTRSERRLEALRLVEYKLHRLEHHGHHGPGPLRHLGQRAHGSVGRRGPPAGLRRPR